MKTSVTPRANEQFHTFKGHKKAYADGLYPEGASNVAKMVTGGRF